jgi:diadenosine tetraphosphate (Ap4A) HIT family hydrolase
LGDSAQSSIIAQRVQQAQAGENPYLVTRMKSGWLVLADRQMLAGHLILLSDPVVSSINDLDETGRKAFMVDMVRAGDALLAVTDSFRVNYEILGNTDPALHGHIVPRYLSEPEEKRVLPVWLYDWHEAPVFSEKEHGQLRDDLGNWFG